LIHVRSALASLLAIGLAVGVSGCGGGTTKQRTSNTEATTAAQSSSSHSSGQRAGGCDVVASPGSAIATVGQLVNALAPGQIGCLRAGTYSSDREVDIRTPGVMLESYPGERATWNGRIVILAPDVTIARLNLDGTSGPLFTESRDRQCQAVGGCTLPSVSVNGPHARIYSNDITNRRGICINARTYAGMTPDRFDIERNRIHDCKPADNHVHGIYISDGADGLIKDNVIFDNGDRGIQLYPNAKHTTVVDNTVDGNRTNIELGSNASGNVIERNIFSFPSTSVADPSQGLGARFNVDAYNPVPSQDSNVVRDNCTYTNAVGYFGGMPIHSGIAPVPGFVAVGNIVAQPAYRNRGAHDFTVPSGSACAGLGAPPSVTAP
jgi:parallel beta-helix repeat protein